MCVYTQYFLYIYAVFLIMCIYTSVIIHVYIYICLLYIYISVAAISHNGNILDIMGFITITVTCFNFNINTRNFNVTRV